MKRSLIFLLPAVFLAAACGSLSELASRQQQYPDGIYFRPQPVVELLTEDDFRSMAAENIAADSLRRKNKLRASEESDYNYLYSPFSYYYYSPYAYRSWWYGGPSYYYRYGLGIWDPFYDPYWDPYWSWSYSPSYWYYGGYYHSPYYYHFLPYAGFSGSSSYNTGYVIGGGNHRRAGSMPSAGTSSSPRRAGSYSSYSGGTSSGSGSSGRSSGNYRRSGGITITPDTSDSGSYSRSGSSTRSSSYSGGGYSGGSSHSSGGYSGGSSHSSGGYSGGSSHSGGSGGGGGGRR